MSANQQVLAAGGGGITAFFDFTTETLDSRITFSRASSATRTNASGALELVSSGNPRFDYDPVGLAIKGLLLERSSTNLLLNSKLDGTNLATQNVTTTAQPYTLTFYGTGTVTLSGTSSGAKAGSGAYPTRSTFTFTPTAGTLTLTVTGTVQYAQLEALPFATSFIPTAGSTVARADELATVTGSNLSSWYNTAEGTFVAQFYGTYASGSGYTPQIIEAPTNGGPQITDNAAGTNLRVSRSGIAYVDSGGFATTDGALSKVAFGYKISSWASSVNGATVQTSSDANAPTSQTAINFGGGSESATIFGSVIRNIAYYKTRKSNAEIVSLST